MNLTAEVQLNIKSQAAKDSVHKAAQLAMKDTIIDVANDSIQGSPKKTGNNARSIAYEVGPGGHVATAEVSGAVFSTSGYGGYLETGTIKMAPRPYMKPALDRNFTKEKFAERVKEHLGSR